ncbi:MAG: GNAT family N-acetyltransferase [Candidatus Berkiella sp.]
MKKIDLIKATLVDKPMIEHMWYYYVYDLTRYCGFMRGGNPTELSFKSDDLTKYFIVPHNHLYLVNIDDEISGFVLVKKLEIMPAVDWFLSEFYIVSKFQGTGIGSAVAKEIFEKFPGEWSVGVLPENAGALKFWRKLISEYVFDNFHEVEKSSEQLKTAEHPDPYPMIMLRFKSPQQKTYFKC